MKSTLIIASLVAAAFSAPTTHRRQAGGNLQTFTGAIGGVAATPILDSGNADRPFQVKADSFVNIGAALQRSCDQQFNACANLANGGDATVSVTACTAQKTQCDAGSAGAAGAAQGGAQAGGNAGSAGNAGNAGNAAAGGNAGNAAAGNAQQGNAGNANACKRKIRKF